MAQVIPADDDFTEGTVNYGSYLIGYPGWEVYDPATYGWDAGLLLHSTAYDNPLTGGRSAYGYRVGDATSGLKTPGDQLPMGFLRREEYAENQRVSATFSMVPSKGSYPNPLPVGVDWYGLYPYAEFGVGARIQGGALLDDGKRTVRVTKHTSYGGYLLTLSMKNGGGFGDGTPAASTDTWRFSLWRLMPTIGAAVELAGFDYSGANMDILGVSLAYPFTMSLKAQTSGSTVVLTAYVSNLYLTAAGYGFSHSFDPFEVGTVVDSSADRITGAGRAGFTMPGQQVYHGTTTTLLGHIHAFDVNDVDSGTTLLLDKWDRFAEPTAYILTTALAWTGGLVGHSMQSDFAFDQGSYTGEQIVIFGSTNVNFLNVPEDDNWIFLPFPYQWNVGTTPAVGNTVTVAGSVSNDETYTVTEANEWRIKTSSPLTDELSPSGGSVAITNNSVPVVPRLLRAPSTANTVKFLGPGTSAEEFVVAISRRQSTDAYREHRDALFYFGTAGSDGTDPIRWCGIMLRGGYSLPGGFLPAWSTADLATLHGYAAVVSMEGSAFYCYVYRFTQSPAGTKAGTLIGSVGVTGTVSAGSSFTLGFELYPTDDTPDPNLTVSMGVTIDGADLVFAPNTEAGFTVDATGKILTDATGLIIKPGPAAGGGPRGEAILLRATNTTKDLRFDTWDEAALHGVPPGTAPDSQATIAVDDEQGSPSATINDVLLPDFPFEHETEWFSQRDTFDAGYTRTKRAFTKARQRFSFSASGRTKTERDALLTFYNARNGAQDSFYFTPIGDEEDSPAGTGTQIVVHFVEDSLKTMKIGPDTYAVSFTLEELL